MSNPGQMLARRIGAPGLVRVLGRLRRRSIMLRRYPHIVSLLILFVPLTLIAVIGKMARIERQYFSALMRERLKAWRAGVRAYYRAYYRIMKAR